MPAPEPPESLAGLSLADIAALNAGASLPPVERWNPPHCGHSGMRIARDGGWWHEGAPIGRAAMVRLFASILRREADGRHVLVTPVELLDIDVEDAAFVAVEMTSEGQGRGRNLGFRLNTGELVVAGPDHALRFGEEGAPEPYLAVRGGLEARLARPLHYELAEIVIAEGADPAGVWSAGAFFAMGPA